MEWSSKKIKQMRITKEQILNGWSFRRILSIVLGGIVIYKAFINQDIISALFGLALIAMGVLNIGCCGNNCSFTPISKKNNDVKEIVYEEVK
jgi:uncharacterized membrane protein HdeD (DUF308 family)